MLDGDTFADIEERIRAAKQQAGMQPLHLVDPTEFQGLPIPERQWIVPDWIPCGVVTGLYGPGGYGKSLLAQQLMTATALGRRWIGLQAEPVPSVGLFCEDDLDELHRRQFGINRFYGCDFQDLGNMRFVPRFAEANLLITFDRHGRGKPSALYTQLCDCAVEFGAKLVIVDTVADTFGGNQNDAGQARQYVQFILGRLAQRIGGAVLACAHPSRAGITSGTGESGSVQWDAAFRSRLYLSAPKKDKDDGGWADPDARVLSRVKANYAARDEAIHLRWSDGVLATDGAGETGSRLDGATVFLQLLDKMTAEGQTLSPNAKAGNYAPRMFVQRPERCGYQRRDFEMAMQLLLSQQEIELRDYGKPSAPRQRIVRAGGLPF